MMVSRKGVVWMFTPNASSMLAVNHASKIDLEGGIVNFNSYLLCKQALAKG